MRALDGDEFAVDAENHRRTDLEMHVRCLPVHGGLQDFVEEIHARRLPEPGQESKAENRTREKNQAGSIA